MKKNLLLAAVLCLALALSACGQNPPAAGSPGSSAAVSSGVASSGTPGGPASQSGRDAHTVLIMEVEGQTEEVPATLYEGEGYSIYIPDEGWAPVEPGEWKAAANSDVELRVEFFSGKTAEEARAAILAEYEQYGFIDADDEGHFTGRDGEAGKTMEVWLTESDGGIYAMLGAYPDEAAEGFGARLPVIAETFLMAE